MEGRCGVRLQQSSVADSTLDENAGIEQLGSLPVDGRVGDREDLGEFAEGLGVVVSTVMGATP
ncbi:MAG: hypothetical protein F2697_03405 [Actinobacteria bacterium]|nr:hypothetical protein [Actinomycetota bacterium]MSZ57558.1 hypothetical protein [Actinomycetota bacterium]